jgi:nucleoside phosphorylase
MRGLAAVGAFGLVAAIPLVIVGFRPSGDLVTKMASLSVAAIGLAVIALALSRSPRPSQDLAAYKTDLRNAVRQQWQAEELRRRLHDPMPIPVRWRIVPSALGVQDHWANVTLGQGQSEIIMAGTIADAAEAFLRLPSGRLVVIGPPGAGKTTLVTRLLLDLIGDSASSAPVPVLLSLSSWDPGQCGLHAWLAGRLTTEHAALGADAGDGRSIAQALIEAGHVMPVLDGLDEMPLATRSLVIRQLNSSLRLGEPIVLTCRTREYAGAVAASDAITAAGVAELLPLSLEDIAGYLRRTTRPGPGMTTKWDPVLARLTADPDEPRSREILTALGPALMTSLAREVYSDTDADPGILFSSDQFTDSGVISAHLLDMAVPVAYRVAVTRPGTSGPGRPQHWLVSLAELLSQTGSYDLAWWQLMDGVPPAILAASGAVVGGVALLAVSLSADLGALVICLLIGLGALVGGVVGLRHRPPPTMLRWRGGEAAARVRRSIPSPGQLLRLRSPVGWLPWIVGAAFLLIVVFRSVGWAGVAGCAGAVLLVRLLDLWFDVPSEVTAAPNPEALLRADRTTAWSRGMLRAFITGGAVAVAVGPGIGLATGFSVLVVSLAFTGWGRFEVARCWYALRGRLPWRLVPFLDDAARRGVLRRVGAVYQFRHARLQDRLARPGTAAGPALRPPGHPDTVATGLSRMPGPVTTALSAPAAGERRREQPTYAEPGDAGRADGDSGAMVILTALEIEYAAVRAGLAQLRPITHPAGTLFESGILPGCRHPVVLAAMGEGNQTAAVVTERAAAMFAPRALLFAGVAGALDDDIALGDVVVGTRIYAYHGGRDEADGFRVRPRAWDAPHELEQRARYISRLGTWIPSGRRPVPSVHFRPIAAGEVVVAAPESGYASRIKRFYSDAAAVEMESAGVLLAAHLNRSLPALAIRGISDRADATKKATDQAGWQQVAAENAAAFALSLVAGLP